MRWNDFDFGGKAWRRLLRGSFEAQVCVDGPPHAYRILHAASHKVALYGVSSMSVGRTEAFLEAAMGVVIARQTVEIPAQPE